MPPPVPGSACWIWGVLKGQGWILFYFYGKWLSAGEVKDRVTGRSITQRNKWMQSVSKQSIGCFWIPPLLSKWMMDPGTVRRAAILIYIRGLRPSLNQGTTGICYLNDKQLLQERSAREGTRRKRWTNQFRFQSGKDTRPRAMTLMKWGSCTGPNRYNGHCSVLPLIGWSPHHHISFSSSSRWRGLATTAASSQYFSTGSENIFKEFWWNN